MGSDYLKGHITKVELSEAFVSPSFIKAIEDLDDYSTDLEDIVKDYTNAMVKARDIYAVLIGELFDTTLPILNMHNVQELELVSQAKELNDSRMQEIVHNLQFNTKENTQELVRETYNRLNLKDPTETLTEQVKDVAQMVQTLTEDFREYKTSTRINNDFFM